MKKCDIRFKVENDLTTIGAVDESNNIQDITAVTEYKNQFDKEARFFYNYKKEVFAFDGYQLKFNESNLKEFNKIQKNENNYYRTRLGDNLVTVRKNLEVFVEQGLNSVENFNFKDKENKLFDKGIPFENISIEQRQALSKQNIIYPANIINKTDLPIEIKNYVNLYNQYISLNSSNRANFATNRSVINENTVLYLDSANKLNYIMAASDLASLEESEVHGNNYLSIALAQRGEQEDVNISESVSDNPVYAKRIVKSGVLELFESNPELANKVYKTLGFKTKADVILPIGTSGSGKSTFIKSLPQENLVVIEPDAMRVEFTGDMNNKSKDKEIYEEAANRAIQAIKQGKQVVFDTTNLTKEKRLPFIEAIKKAIPTANIQYKLMELNPELAKQRIKAQLARGENRAAVSDETIDRHAASYKQMLEDIKNEPISNFEITPQQKQQAQQLYSQYLEQNPNGSVEEFKSWVNGKNSFDKELAQKIQDKLQKLYPEIKLNITNNPVWEQGDNVLIKKNIIIKLITD